MTAFTYQLLADLGPAYSGVNLQLRLRSVPDGAVNFADGATTKEDGAAGCSIEERPGSAGQYSILCSQWPLESLPFTAILYDVDTSQVIPGSAVEFNAQDFQQVAGPGATAFTYTLTSSVDDAPIAGADVWVTTDEAGTNTIARGVTDSNGDVVFYLDAGTFYFWRQLATWTFTNPDTEVVG